MSEKKMKLSSAEFEQQFFAGAEKVALEIELLRETYDDIQATIERNGWEPDEGPLILLTLGLGYAKGQLAIKADDEAQAGLVDRLAILEGEQPEPELSWFDRLASYFKRLRRD